MKIGFLGFGNMASAIFKILKKDKSKKFFACTLIEKKIKNLKYFKTPAILFEECDVVFLCTKPQDFKELDEIKINDKTIVISIMAGVSVKEIQNKIGTKRVVRTMPNLPLQIGEGVIGYYAKNNIFSEKELKSIEKLIDKLGESIEVKSEEKINAITAISGSGPAYVWMFVENLVNASRKLGLNKQDSEKIVYQTILGSLKYSQNSNKDLNKLINMICSKKGTTEAALKSINPEKQKQAWEKATRGAYNRAIELSK